MSADDYAAQLEVLERVIPNNALLPRLRQGYTSTNARYLKRLMSENVAPAPKTRTRLVTSPTTDEPDTEEWARLCKRKSSLYKLRGKTSNRFHDFPDSVNERANISREIRHLQVKIKRVHREMAHYRNHGELPENDADQEEAVYTEAEAMKARHALNAKMSRIRANLKQHATNKPEKVKEWEAQMKECEREREIINRQIGQIRL